MSTTEEESEEGSFAFDLSEVGSVSEESEGGEIRQIRQDYSISSCATADADRTFTTDIDPSYLSPRSYNTCFKGYVADLNDIGRNYARVGVGGGGAARIYVYASDTMSTKAQCEGTSLRVVAYTHKIGVDNWRTESGVFDTGTRYGTWHPAQDLGDFGTHPAYCSLEVSFYGMSPGADYRFAITSRYAGETRKVRVYSAPAVDLF